MNDGVNKNDMFIVTTEVIFDIYKKTALMGDHPAHSLKKIDVDEFSTGETDANKLKTTDNDRNMIREYVW